MMPTLSSFFPLRRLAVLRRIPFWAQALAVCALFVIAGVAVMDDYGVTWDDAAHRRIVVANAHYIATGDISGISQPADIAYRYYGVTFGMPIVLVERALGLQDSRRIYVTRHLIMHLYFIAGGFVCAMLAYRMVGGRLIALFAMLMFLLHPRFYAHSFFNTKDIPFAVMLFIALYLARRAFLRDTVGAFLLCGIGVGLAINVRPFGMMLLPMILAMRALDLWQAGRVERKRILTTGVVFTIMAVATAYIAHPYYWESPMRFIDGARALAQHPNLAENLFMGKIYLPDAVPWNYIPVWFVITAPPVALLIGAFGAAAVCWQAIRRPLAALRDRELRFRILLLGCFALPVVVVIALQANIYNGWRQMFFLWTPFCLLAAVGLHCIVDNSSGDVWKIAARLPRWVRGGRMRRTLAYGAMGIGLITTLTAMAALHPYEQVYFNALVDTNTPGALGERYDMDYWQLAQRQSLEYLLARYPEDTLRVAPGKKSRLILPQSDRERLVIAEERAADYHLYPIAGRWKEFEEPAFHSVQAYGSDIAVIESQNKDAYLDKHRAEYADVAANGTLLARADFDIYAHEGGLYYLNADCALSDNAHARFFLHIFPINPADLPADRREHGFINEDFSFGASAAFFDGKCIHIQPLPNYPIARIETGHKGDGMEWSANINLEALARYERISAGDYGQPIAQSHFDVYMRGNALAYIKAPCAPGDADARFFLHIFPTTTADLPADSREHGFDNLDFEFSDYGGRVGDICVASSDLPPYPIDLIRTGQFVSAEGRVWSAEFPAAQ